jgi:hypothetical protein
MRLSLLVLGFFILCVLQLFGQNNNSTRTKKIAVNADTLTIDTLSISSQSLAITDASGNLIDTSIYKILLPESKIILYRKKIKAAAIKLDTIIIQYKTFPFLFSKEIKHKSAMAVKPDIYGNRNPFTYSIDSKKEDIFKMEGLNKTGSISRGITVGTNQDMVVNSNLNLQLSGRLSNNIDILLAATDNNIPLQADGNTQQLQEFDKVFIQLSRDNTKLIAGDFQQGRPSGYFMNFNKKNQGISFSTAANTRYGSNTQSKGIYTTTLSAAVSRGKFARNQIQGVESNQGPYRLRGAENELFIVVLSGTEKVYIDGRIMDRGQENDYIINYNTAEITFTAKQLITKDKRIVVEFQYSDKNYARSIIFAGNDYEQKNMKTHLHIYSEQDSKNQPLQQNLSDEQKLLLAEAGDDFSKAISPSYSLVEFNNSEVLYIKKDSAIGTKLFSNVFVYNPTKVYVSNGVKDSSQHFRVTYSNVGQGNGNYRQVNSTVNGKVFEWIMPDTTTNQLRGNYEPIIQLITPQKKQMITGGIDYEFSKSTKLTVEGAFTNNDINTFSSNNKKNDKGFGIKLNFENSKKVSHSNDTVHKPLQLITNLNYELINVNFVQIERFRTIEFERDWNRLATTTTNDQHILTTTLGLQQQNRGEALYKFSTFLEGNNYKAFKHNLQTKFTQNSFSINYDGSLMNSEGLRNTSFYRHKSAISKQIKKIVIGAKDEFEQNKFYDNQKQSLLSNSYKFWEWQAFVKNADTTKAKYGAYYKHRTDYLTNPQQELKQATLGKSYGVVLELLGNSKSEFKMNAAYRTLETEQSLTTQKPDNSLLARIEYNFRVFKGALISNTFYEIGSGLELKKEFSFIQVPPGQGIYTWIDYNNNNVKELNEFEISAFPDQAIYIKIFTPTNEYIKTYNNQIAQTIMLRPSAIWQNRKGFRKIIALFANQTAYRVDKKTTEQDLARAYNPFLTDPKSDASLVSLNSSFRNTLFFNQQNTVFGIEFTYQNIQNRILLVNGIDKRINESEETRIRWNFSQLFNTIITARNGQKSSISQYFSTRNYNINYFEIEPVLNYQPNTTFRTALVFKYTQKKNQDDYGGQRAVLQDYGVEIKYNVLNKGSLNGKFNFIQIAYSEEQQNSALSFEMLNALNVGKNYTWGLNYQRTLSNNLQLNITYDGRKPQLPAKIVHTGGIQVRAYF